jgi:hypothetical protein
LDMVVHTCNLSAQEAEAGGSQIWGQPELHSKTLSKKKKENEWRGISLQNPHTLKGQYGWNMSNSTPVNPTGGWSGQIPQQTQMTETDTK